MSQKPETYEEESVHVGEPDSKGRRVSPWSWVVSVNFAQGLQYVVVTDLFGTIIFLMGLDKGTAAFWTSLLQMPWTIKPLWGPLVDRYWTKRNWTVWMQGLVGLAFAGIGLSLLAPSALVLNWLPAFLLLSLVFLFLIAFSGATHDIACDGYYMLTLTERQQAFYVGIRSTAFRLAMVAANGVLLWMASGIQRYTGPEPSDVAIHCAAPGANAEEVPLEGKFSRPEKAVIVVEPESLQLEAGKKGNLTVCLSEPVAEGKTRVVLLRYHDGSKNISVDKERIEFTPANWNQPVTVTVSTDKNLKENVATVFRATAGNVPLSWSLTMALCSVFFLFCAFYHGYILPYPAAEHKQEATSRPPFYVPLGALGVTVLLPVVLAIVAYMALWYYGRPALQPRLLGVEPSVKALKGFEFLFNIGSWIAIVGAGAVLFMIPPIGSAIKNFFRRMSDVSGIGFADVFSSYFAKPHVGLVLGFLLTFRLGEVQLTKIKNLFLLDGLDKGGLAFSQDALGFTNSVVYTTALILGGLTGGFLISKFGLKRVIWPMVLAMHLPNLGFVYMSHAIPTNYYLINTLVGMESFFYGFGFTSYLLVMIMFSQGPYKTAHYALCTGFMALGAMIPGMWSGYLAELTGYVNFFWIVMISCLPGLAFIPFLPIDAEFGKKAHK